MTILSGREMTALTFYEGTIVRSNNPNHLPGQVLSVLQGLFKLISQVLGKPILSFSTTTGVVNRFGLFAHVQELNNV